MTAKPPKVPFKWRGFFVPQIIREKEIENGIAPRDVVTTKPTTACQCGKTACRHKTDWVKITLMLTVKGRWTVDLVAGWLEGDGKMTPQFSTAWETQGNNPSLDEVSAAIPGLLKRIPH